MPQQRRDTRGKENLRNRSSSPTRNSQSNKSQNRRSTPQTSGRHPSRQNAPENSRSTRNNPPRKRRRKRRGSLFLLYVLIGFLLTVTGITLSLTVLFNVKSYKIIGDTRYGRDEIISIIPIEKGDNLFRMNKKNAADKLKKALPYLDEVKLSRGLPSTLVINLKELSAEYTLEIGESFCLAAENYKILEPVSEIQEKTTYVKGLKLKNFEIGEIPEFKDEKQKNRLDLVISSLNQSELNKIRKIDIADNAAIQAVYDGRIRLFFGTTAELDKKIQAAEEIVLRQKPKGTQGTLDLSKIESGNVKSVFKEENIDE